MEEVIRPKKTVFIFGISSFVGSNLAEYLKQDYRVIGSYHHHPVEIDGVLTIPLDATKRDASQLVMALFRPDITIYCACISSVDTCNENEMLANTLNATAVFNLSNFTEQNESRLIYISSSYVFSGEKGEHTEDDIPSSNSIYGKSKSSAEFFIQNNSLNYLILRCCQLYGRGIAQGRSNWFELMQKKLFAGEKVDCYGNVRTGFLDITYLGIAIKMCIERGINKRLIHISSSDIMSQYDFALEYAKSFADQEDLINRSIWNFPHIRPSAIYNNSSDGLEYALNTQATEELLQVKMPSISQSLNFTKTHFSTGRVLDEFSQVVADH